MEIEEKKEREKGYKERQEKKTNHEKNFDLIIWLILYFIKINLDFFNFIILIWSNNVKKLS